jgi:hypothetical protein
MIKKETEKKKKCRGCENGKIFIGVFVLNGKRPGRKDLPSWYWNEGGSWHVVKIY